MLEHLIAMKLILLSTQLCFNFLRATIYMTSIYNFAQDLPALPAANKTLARRKRANHDSRDTSIYCYVRTSVRANLVCQIEDSS